MDQWGNFETKSYFFTFITIPNSFVLSEVDNVTNVYTLFFRAITF